MSSDGLKQRKNKGAGSEPTAASPAPKSKPDEGSTDAEANKGHSKALPEATPSARASSSNALDWLEMHERWIPVFLLFITGFTRFYRLDKPTGVVFDEFHFGRFTNQYHAGTYLFDIHPPLGKLVFYYVSRLAGYNHEDCGYANIQDQYAPQCQYYILRAIAAFFGTITAPAIFGVLRNFGGSVRAGLVAALLFTFDGLNTSESRLVLIDSQLIFWCTASLLVAQWWWRRWNAHWNAVAEFEAATGYTPGLLFAGNPAALLPVGASHRAAMIADVPDAVSTALAASSGGAAPGSGVGSDAAHRAGALPVSSRGGVTSGASSGASTPPVSAGSGAAAGAAAAKAPAHAVASRVPPRKVVERAALLSRDPRTMQLGERAGWCVAVGLACANAISIKFTGLATPGMVAVESFFAVFFLKRSIPLIDLLAILLVAAVVFIFYYYLHFGLLPSTGDGDAFMAVDFQRTLVNNTHYDPNAPKPGLLRMVYELNHEMIVASARIEQRHHWDSVWWEWMLNLRGILYYSRDAGHTYTETVYLLGNPLVIWPVLAALGLVVVMLFFYGRYRTDPLFELPQRYSYFVAASTFCFLAYWLNLLPYLAVRRSSFIYHYMPALCYGEMLVALVVEQLAGRRWMHPAMLVVVGTAAVGYLIYAPWVYAFPLTGEGHARRRWLSRWD